MSFPPNNNNDPHSELELLEGLLNNMFSGATSMLFKSLQEPLDLGQQTQGHSYTSTLDDLDGNDFRRIAEKRRQRNHQVDTTNNNQQIDTAITPSPQSIISNSDLDNMGKGLVGLWGSLLGDLAQQQQSSTDHHNDKNTGWTFTSSSTSHQRTIQPDGTEEVVTTTRRNGRTETVTTIRHPDGTLQEYRNTSDRPTILSMLSPTPNDNIDSTLSGPPRSNNPLSNLLRSIWG